MAGNPVLGFLNAPTNGTGPHGTVTKTLRLLGIAALVGFVFGLVNAVLTIAMGTSYAGTTGAAVAAGAAITALAISVVITGLICWWITYTINAWTTGQPNGPTHVLVIGIIAAVLGGWGVLNGLVIGTIFGSGVNVLYTLVALLGLLASAFELYCGVVILMNRSKATGRSNATNTGATN